jgi:DtxR family Mn-dependent transcriptional regulator
VSAAKRPLVVPLTELEIGEKGRIIFIVPKSHARLDKLGSLGLVPGSTIRIHQKRPAYVIEIGETTLGLDPEIVKEIYVKKAS